MSKFSSYKQSQLLFESWRRHINEEEGDVSSKELGERAGELSSRMFEIDAGLDKDAANINHNLSGFLKKLERFKDRENKFNRVLEKFDADFYLRNDPNAPEEAQQEGQVGRWEMIKHYDPSYDDELYEDVKRLLEDLKAYKDTPEPEELGEQSELPTEASDILDDLKGAEEENPKAFNMALGALSKEEGV